MAINFSPCLGTYRGFRIHAETLELTHVSRGPIVSSYMAQQPHDFLVVLSYHFTQTNGFNSLTVNFGRNDTLACYDTIAAEHIEWYEVQFGAQRRNVSDPRKLDYKLT